MLSEKIFGITQEERSGIFAYINLGDYFIDPSCYKAWSRINPLLKKCIAKDGKFVVDTEGKLKEVPAGGDNGLKFLKKNIDRIQFQKTDTSSIRKDFRIKYLELNRKKMFINKYIVIPPLYRDTNTSSGSKGSISVSEINHMYQQLIVISKGLKTTQEYGFDMSGDQELRMQEMLLQIYDWFSGTTNKKLENEKNTTGISGKFGVLRRANMSKTSDYAARLVITAPDLKANSPKEMLVDFDHTAVPLSAVLACFKPFVIYHMRRFFENEFIGSNQYQIVDKTGKSVFKAPKDPLIAFSDEVLQQQMEQYIHGYANRLIPIVIPMEDGTQAYMAFKGRYKDIKSSAESILNRRMTWLDVLYISAVEATKNKKVLISRFPIKYHINSTIILVYESVALSSNR